MCMYKYPCITKCSVYSGYATRQWPNILHRDNTVHKAMYQNLLFHVAIFIGNDVLATGTYIHII